MKTLHLLSSTGYHGAENMVAQLIKALTAQGVSNAVGVFYGKGNSNREVLLAVQDHVLDDVVFPCNKRLDISAILSLRRYILDNDIQIIHSHKYKTNLHAFFSVMGTPVKLVSTCHNWLGSSLKMKFYAALDKQVLKGFDAAVGVSTQVEEELARHLPRKKVWRVENGIDLDKFSVSSHVRETVRRELGLSSKNVIGYVGRLSRGKGLQFLLEAIARMVPQYDRIFCLIVGDGEYITSLRDAARDLGISDRVNFTGRRNDTPRLYSAMDMFVLPSLEEAFPMVVLEAMASGVAVVATDAGDIPHMIEDGVSGLLVEKRNPDSLKEALTFLVEHKEEAENMASQASHSVQQNFSSQTMAKRYLEIYEQIIQGQ